MRRSDLVVTIGADQQEVPYTGLGGQMFQQVEGRGVQPLKIVEEQHERTSRLGKNAHEPAEHPVEAVPRVLRWEVGNGRLRANDELELRDQLDHELGARTQRFTKCASPATDLRIALAKDLTDEAL